MNLQTQIEVKMKDIKASRKKDKLQNRIQAVKGLRHGIDHPIKGRGAILLENIGKIMQTSASEGYGKCISPSDAAKVFLIDFKYFVESGIHLIKYGSEKSILFYIEGDFYEVTDSDIKVALPQMAVNAGCPVQLTSGAFRKEVFEKMMDIFKRLDPTFDEMKNFILGK